jgi:hypothetical protein
MSTRGIIVFIGKEEYGQGSVGYRLYQHCDSYPTNTLQLLREVIGKAEEQCAEYSQKHPTMERWTNPNPEQCAGLYVGANTSPLGIGAKIEQVVHVKDSEQNDRATALVSEGVLGNQCDLEWIYIVDAHERHIKVYGGGYTGEGGEWAFAQGTVDPTSYADHLIEECAADTRRKIRAHIQAINTLGWKVN